VMASPLFMVKSSWIGTEHGQRTDDDDYDDDDDDDDDGLELNTTTLEPRLDAFSVARGW